MELSLGAFLGDRSGFEPFGFAHLIPLALFCLFTFMWIRVARKKSKEYQFRSALMFSIVVSGSVIVWMLFKLATGRFDLRVDLPLHLCNLLGVVFPFVIYYRSRPLFGILYFFVLAGTLQAIITPELKEPFPHFIYFRFWLLHCGLISLTLYCLFVFQWEVFAKDIWTSIIAANVYLVFSIIINLCLKSNYFYSLSKPQTPSLLDYLGQWPWYLLTGQLVMLALFVIYYLPIHVSRRRRQKTKKPLPFY